MKELQTVLNNILTDKNTNLKPENIKKGVTCLGVTGTLEASTSSGGVKQFSTVEEMNASTGNTEGDLAIVYSSILANMTADTETQYITFPDTVTLPAAFTGEYYGMIREVDSSAMFDGQVMLNQTSFEFSGYSGTGEITVNYTSTDGITYTRSTTITNPVDLGTVVKSYAEWNDNLGYFMQTGGMYFDGLYDFRNYLDKDYFRFIPISNIDFASGTPVWNGIYTSEKYSVADVQAVVRQMKNDGVISKIYGLHSFIDSDNDLIISENLPDRYIINSSGNLIGMGETTTSSYTYKLYKIDLDRHTYSLKSTKSKVGTLTVSNDNYGTFDIMAKTIQVLIYIDRSGEDTITRYQDYSGFYLSNSLSGTATSTSMDFTGSYYDTYNKYQIAPTQLTATVDDVYEKEFYGKNGASEGNLQKTDNLTREQLQQKTEIYNLFSELNVSEQNLRSVFSGNTKIKMVPVLNIPNAKYTNNMFSSCSNLKSVILNGLSAVETANSMFENCTLLETVTDTSESGFNNLTNATYMYKGCTNLVNVPNITSNKVTTYDRAFQNCTSLVNAPECNFSVTQYTNGMYDGCTSLISVPNYDLSAVVWVNGMFSGCTNLVTVPQFNIGSAKYVQAMFENCSNLSDDSLNNILLMCTTVSSGFTQDKTLKQIGLTSAQATKCKTLSNYSAFTAAGWTTGY